MKKTTHVVNAVPYYTEAITMEDKDTKQTATQMFCYDNTGSLVYLVSSPDTADEQIVHIQCSKAIPESAILSIPNGWSVYTVTYSADHSMTVKDQSGRELTTEKWKLLPRRSAEPSDENKGPNRKSLPGLGPFCVYHSFIFRFRSWFSWSRRP